MFFDVGNGIDLSLLHYHYDSTHEDEILFSIQEKRFYTISNVNESIESIKDVLLELKDVFEKEEIEFFDKLSEGIDFTRIEDGETFSLLLKKKFDMFLNGFIAQKFGNNNDIKFTLLNHRFLERHFLIWIKKHEGSSCSADKSRAIMRGLLKFHQTGEKIVWDYDGEYTYHLPKKVFRSHENIIRFYHALKSLFYGNPEKYLVYLRNIFLAKKHGDLDQ